MARYKSYKKMAGNKANAFIADPFKHWKFILFGGIVIYFIYRLRKGGGFFDKLLAPLNLLQAGGHGYGTDPDESVYSTVGQSPGDSGGYLAGDPVSGYITIKGKKISPQIRNLIDEIYNHLNGLNMFSYPEIVNRIADLSTGQIWNCIVYWNYKYKGSTGANLYGMIAAEELQGVVLGGLKYGPALSKIKSLGWKNK